MQGTKDSTTRAQFEWAEVELKVVKTKKEMTVFNTFIDMFCIMNFPFRRSRV